MNIVLTALNAKFIHSSLALRSIEAYCKKYKDHIHIAEYTINHEENFILREIFKLQPDLLGFSCYIWNIEMILSLVKTCKKVLPDTKILLGGPEVSYDGEQLMEKYPEIDFIAQGEGEQTLYDLMEYFIDGTKSLDEINGIVLRQKGKIVKNNPAPSMDLNKIPFVYEEFSSLKNRIIYYEATRGCPYQCQYCLSSTEQGVRFLELDRVFSDLQHFLNAGVQQVKFVDRTFNCKKSYAMAIWEYLKEHDNGITNFHFEISADLLDIATLEFLATVRSGLFQFEIGVQSTNSNVLQYIRRKMDFEKLKEIVQIIKKPKNIHQHLDLIAGLPGEDYSSFRQSFNDVYALYPEQLQLGFLKLLKGSGLRRDAEKYGLIYKHLAPYEILYTKELNYEQMLKLKMIEEMVERYYNSGRFYYSVQYMITQFFDSPFDFYEALAAYWEQKGYHMIQHNKMRLYTILLEFLVSIDGEYCDIYKQILKFDMYLHEKVRKLPEEMDDSAHLEYKQQVRDFYRNEENIQQFLPELKEYDSKQISRMVHLEVFPMDLVTWAKDMQQGKYGSSIKMTATPILFNYYAKDELLGHANFYKVMI